MEPVTGDESQAKKKPTPVDRVALGRGEGQRVEAWLSQINEFSKGYLSLSKSDIVNFLLRQHAELLSAKELVQLRHDHYDPVRHITWIAPQIRQALKDGDMARVRELQDELRKVELSAQDQGDRAGGASRPPQLRERKRNNAPDETSEKREQPTRAHENFATQDRS